MINLSQPELAELTGRRRPTAQARALDFLGITYRKRPDGSLVVLRQNAELLIVAKLREPALRFAK